MPTCIGRAGGQFCYRRKNWSATPMILWCKEYITRKKTIVKHRKMIGFLSKLNIILDNKEN